MAERSVTFWYGRAEDGYESRYELTVRGAYDLSDKFDQEMLAKDAARDYHSNHDGWEASWPCEFALAATEDGPEVARFIVDRDVEPVFYARRPRGVPAVAAPDAKRIAPCADAPAWSADDAEWVTYWRERAERAEQALGLTGKEHGNG